MGVTKTIVSLETRDQDLVWSRLTGPVAKIRHSGILHCDTVEEGKIWSIFRVSSCKIWQFIFQFWYQHLKSTSALVIILQREIRIQKRLYKIYLAASDLAIFLLLPVPLPYSMSLILTMAAYGVAALSSSVKL